MTAVRTVTRIQDMDDSNITPGGGVDGYAFVYDDATQMFVLDSMEYDRVFRSNQDYPEYGAELIANGSFESGDFTSWTAGAGWSVVDNKAKHTSGTAALSQVITQDQIGEASRRLYKVSFTISGRTAGSISASLAGVTFERIRGITSFDVDAVYPAVINANTTDANITLSIVPTTDFDGSVDSISVVSCGTATPFITSIDTTSSVPFDIHGFHGVENAPFELYSLGIGRRTLERNLGFANVGLGTATLSRVVSGGRNTGLGESALAMLLLGSSETAVGQSTLLADVTGWRNTAVGAYAGTALLTGYRNSFFGAQSALGFLRGERNVILGAYAGAVASDGSTPITELNDSVLVGAEIRSTEDSTNEIAIGTAAVGLGSNTTVIGNSSTTLTALFGALRIPQLGAAPTGAAGYATLYAIDNGSGKMKLCAKLGDDVEIVIATQA